MSGSIIAFNKGMDSPILCEQLYSCEKTRPKQNELFNIQSYVSVAVPRKREENCVFSTYVELTHQPTLAQIVNPFFSE